MNLDELPQEAQELIARYIRMIEAKELETADLIRQLAEQMQEKNWVPSEYVSSFIKKILKGRVSDRTIERALGEGQKQSQMIRRHESPNDDKKVLTQTTDGITYMDGNPKEIDDEFGKGVVPSTVEKSEPVHRVHRIVMTAYALNELGKAMQKKVAHMSDSELRRTKKLYGVEHDLDEKVLYVFEAEEEEAINVI